MCSQTAVHQNPFPLLPGPTSGPGLPASPAVTETMGLVPASGTRRRAAPFFGPGPVSPPKRPFPRSSSLSEVASQAVCRWWWSLPQPGSLEDAANLNVCPGHMFGEPENSFRHAKPNANSNARDAESEETPPRPQRASSPGTGFGGHKAITWPFLSPQKTNGKRSSTTCPLCDQQVPQKPPREPRLETVVGPRPPALRHEWNVAPGHTQS